MARGLGEERVCNKCPEQGRVGVQDRIKQKPTWNIIKRFIKTIQGDRQTGDETNTNQTERTEGRREGRRTVWTVPLTKQPYLTYTSKLILKNKY